MRAPLRAVLLCSVLLVAGCGGGNAFGDPATVGEVARLVLEEAPEAAGALRRTGDAPIGPVEVYVDLSLSIQPYLAPAGTGGAPAFSRLVEALDNSLGSDVEFFGFGFEPDSAAQTVTAISVGRLTQAATYTRVNNDYGALFAGFRPDSMGSLGATRVVITDGVESDPEGGPRFGRVVAAADRWVRAGGVFAAFVYRADYSGTYFTEGAACPRGRLAMSCADRPLVAFVFAPTAGQADQLRASMGDDLQPEHVVQVGGRDADLVPVAEVAVEGSRRPRTLLRGLSQTVAPGFEAVPTASVDNRAADAQGFVPLEFTVRVDTDAEPWRSLSTAERAAFLRTLRPRLRAFAVSTRRDSVSIREVEADVYRPTVTVDSVGVAHVILPVKRPTTTGVGVGGTAADGARHFAFLLSLAPYESASGLVPDGLSTPTDCDAARCGQTLNLAPLLGAILRDDYVPARTLLLAEWRER
ncbi:MAG TPA: hypothetical protein VGB53_08070 [Rubricoccaceae bacterium]|jgi:hypothetical protein